MRQFRSVFCLRAAAALLVVFSFLAPESWADFYEPKNGCRRPPVKQEPMPMAERVVYNAEVEEYRACLEEFIDSNRAAAARHESSATAAEREWHEFQKDIY